MKTKILRNALLTLGAGLAAVLAPPTVDGQVVAFNAELNQTTLVSQSCNAGVCNLVFEGSGSSNIMGAVTWTAQIVQDNNTNPCFSGIAGSGTDQGTISPHGDRPVVHLSGVVSY